jgi:hypothetical protein
MFILSALGLALAAAGTAYGWWSSGQGANAAGKAAEESAQSIEENARTNNWLNQIAEQRFSEQQSIALGDISAGVSKQNMTGTPGGEAYQDSAEKTAQLDMFLMKYKDTSEVQNLMKQAQIVREGGQANADAMRTSGNANAVSNLSNLAIRSGSLFSSSQAGWVSNMQETGSGQGDFIPDAYSGILAPGAKYSDWRKG